MADFGTIDTSSYPKPQAGSSVLDTVGKLQGLESQSIEIDQSKLKLINDRYSIVSRELQGLYSDPNVDFKKVSDRFQNLVNLGLIPSNMMAQAMKDVPTNQAEIPAWIKMKAVQGQAVHDAINSTYGQPGLYNQGQQAVPTRTGTFVPGGIQRDPNGIPIQLQPPPNTEIKEPEFLSNGQPNPNAGKSSLLGPQAEQPTPGSRLPVRAPNAPINTSPLPVGTDTLPDGSTRTVGPNLAQNAYPTPSGLSTSNSPLFEEGKAKFNKDQELATQKLTALKPLINALDLVKQLRSGPGTETWNKAVAFGKANGIIPTSANDPTAIYQEANKYFNNYIQQSGTRSDADLAQRELSNPNVTQQIQPALEELTKKQIARDRIEAARAGAFSETDKDGKVRMRNDFSNYGNHSSKFPPQMDERAFIIDKLEPKERQQLLDDMVAKAKKGDKSAIKFFNSLETAKRSGVFQ